MVYGADSTYQREGGSNPGAGMSFAFLFSFFDRGGRGAPGAVYRDRYITFRLSVCVFVFELASWILSLEL